MTARSTDLIHIASRPAGAIPTGLEAVLKPTKEQSKMPKFAIYYYDVLIEIVEMPTRNLAVRYMGARYGGTVGMHIVG
jgi:hypothetical protein